MAINEYGDYKHQKGYDAAIVDINSQTSVELSKESQKALDDIAQDNSDSVERVRIEYTTNTEIKEVIKYVDKEIIVPADCEPLAAHVVSVLNQATSAVSRSAKSADTD